jgi:hypothetical protein
MACGDKSTKFLKDLGFNVVKHPRKGIRPLELIGRQNGAVTRLGILQQLIKDSESPLPQVFEDEPAANINGQTSSDLSIGIGINVLGAILSAMGGNLGLNVSYTNAKKITFVYTDVLSDRVQPLDVGNFLRDGDVDAGNLILREYVLGHGELFLITETIKANKFSLNHETKNGVELKVDVPVIQEMVGGNVAVKREGASSKVLSFEGTDFLTFGFKCLRVGVADGVLSLVSSAAGETALEGVGSSSPEPQILVGDGLVDVGN